MSEDRTRSEDRDDPPIDPRASGRLGPIRIRSSITRAPDPADAAPSSSTRAPAPADAAPSSSTPREAPDIDRTPHAVPSTTPPSGPSQTRPPRGVTRGDPVPTDTSRRMPIALTDEGLFVDQQRIVKTITAIMKKLLTDFVPCWTKLAEGVKDKMWLSFRSTYKVPLMERRRAHDAFRTRAMCRASSTSGWWAR